MASIPFIVFRRTCRDSRDSSMKPKISIAGSEGKERAKKNTKSKGKNQLRGTAILYETSFSFRYLESQLARSRENNSNLARRFEDAQEEIEVTTRLDKSFRNAMTRLQGKLLRTTISKCKLLNLNTN